MNPLLVELVAMYLRQLAMMLVGAVGLTQVVQPLVDRYMSDFTQASLSFAGALLLMAYTTLRKVNWRQKLVQALSEANTTERTIERMVADKTITTPSVMTPKTEIPRGGAAASSRAR